MLKQGGGRCYGRGKIAPRLLPRLVLCDQCAPLVQPPLTRLPRRLFQKIFSTPLAALPLNLRTGIYNTALAALVDIPPLSAVGQCSRKRKARMGRKKTGVQVGEHLCYHC